jgi:hypothetical protein
MHTEQATDKLNIKRCTKKNMPDYYLVKYYPKHLPNNPDFTWYGIHQKSHSRALEFWTQQKALLIEDAITGKLQAIPIRDFVVEPIPMYRNGDFNYQTDKQTGMPLNNEYDQFVNEKYIEAMERSDKAGKGLAVGKMFSVCVADGRAYYVVIKVNKKTCRVEWQGFGLDRYVDQVLGYGGTFPKHVIERQIDFIDWMDGVFRTHQGNTKATKKATKKTTKKKQYRPSGKSKVKAKA